MPIKEVIKNSKLTINGYKIPKKNITEKQLNKIKKDLTVAPLNSFVEEDDKTKVQYKVYTQDETHITVPRYYGMDKLGKPEKTSLDVPSVKIEFNGELRDYQTEIVNTSLAHMKKYGGGLISVPCGYGKCLAKGTLVIMYNGSLKKVEDIKVGDEIMGDNSTPRKILSLARGKEEMFDIIPSNGEKYTVNRSHILSLKWGATRSERINGVFYKKDDIIDISVDDYLKLPKMYNSIGSPLRGYRVPISFKFKECPIEPYFLGALLGNGMNTIIQITQPNGKIIDHHKEYTEKMNLIKNKHIPDIFKYNSREVRLDGLAGLIDTNGNITSCKTGFEITQKSKVLFDDIVYLARSLGFLCYKSHCTNSNHLETYYRIGIFGKGTHEIPTKLPHKQAQQKKQIKNVLDYGITVKSIGMGKYYGFEIDGNKRFVLGDFSVTHNTSMSIYLAHKLGLRSLILTHKSFLQDQWIKRIKQFTGLDAGIIRQKKVDVEDKNFVVGMIQSIGRREYDPKIFEGFGLLIIDEAHHYSSKYFSKALFKVGATYTIGLSATPYRSDGLIKVMNWFIGDIMYEKKLRINNQVVSKIITFSSKDKLFAEKSRYMKGQVRPDCVKMITNLTELKARNNHIINVIDELRKDPERKILILSGRKNHLKVLKDAVDNMIDLDVKSKAILEDECKTHYYTGDLKRDEREEAEANADILFATYDMAHEGLDIERLNTIILATPKKDVVQAVGRILRKVLQNGDIRPLIIDFVDNLSIFKNQAIVREKFYTKSKYVQHYYYALEKELISPRKYLELIGEKNDKVSKNVPRDYAQILEVPVVEIEECNDEESIDKESDKKPKKSAAKSMFF
jgi:superfamily II DNA or RNA helicase